MAGKKRVRKKIEPRHQHIAVYFLLLAVPVLVYLATGGGKHLPAVQTNIDAGLSFFDWLMDRLLSSADRLTALVSVVLALAYTLKILRK